MFPLHVSISTVGQDQSIMKLDANAAVEAVMRDVDANRKVYDDRTDRRAQSRYTI